MVSDSVAEHAPLAGLDKNGHFTSPAGGSGSSRQFARRRGEGPTTPALDLAAATLRVVTGGFGPGPGPEALVFISNPAKPLML